jgi:SSS family solute:Na+ symporter
MNLIVIAIYIGAMIGIGWYAKRRVKSETEFLVAGRRLGPLLYAGTMSAIVLGGASTIGGVGLGYQYGISGMWLVFSIGCGILFLSLVFAARINRLEVFTVSQMLELRYGPGASLLSGLVMCGYTLMLAVTSTIAYGDIFGVLFGIGKVPAILIGGGVVILYSVLGGMWSITLTDFVQFLIKSIGIFGILLPLVLIKAGGLQGLHDHLPETAFAAGHIGTRTIVTNFVIYFFGLVIGQDIWQRVFTARSEQVAKWAGTAAGLYCLLYALAGAVIGMCAKVLLPNIANRDDVYAEIVRYALPVGLSGLVMAAALSAIMSTSSGALIATATVAKEDIVRAILRRRLPLSDGVVHPPLSAQREHDEVRDSRWYILGFGIAVVLIACVLRDVVAALTISYDILVGGLLVAIVGGILWRRGTIAGALTSIATGTILTLATMVVMADMYASEPVFIGLAGSLIAYIAVSLVSRRTDPAIQSQWDNRMSRERSEVADGVFTDGSATADFALKSAPE